MSKESFFGMPDWDKMQQASDDFNEARARDIATHPNNGTLGWWKVVGLRHHAYCRAASAAEAIQKALDADLVGDWEAPLAHWMGEVLPDVF